MDLRKKLQPAALAGTLLLTGCATTAPTGSGAAPSVDVAYPTSIDELEVYADRPLKEFFSSARFEVRSGWLATQDKAEELGIETEGVEITTTGELDFAERQFSGLIEVNQELRGSDEEAPKADLYAEGEYSFMREWPDEKLDRDTIGPWFDAPAYSAPFYFDRRYDRPSDFTSLFEDFDVTDPQFHDLGEVELRGINTRHFRYQATVESMTDMWGEGEETLIDLGFELWLDESGRPVRSRVELPFTDFWMLLEVEFWDLNEVTEIDLPDNLDVRPNGEYYGTTGVEVSHSAYGTTSLGPSETRSVLANNLEDGFTRVEAEIVLPFDENARYALMVGFSMPHDGWIEVYEPADGGGTAAPGLFAVWVNATSLDSGEVTEVLCPNGALRAGELRVFEAEFDHHGEHVDPDRLHFEFDYSCTVDGEEWAASGTYRWRANN